MAIVRAARLQLDEMHLERLSQEWLVPRPSIHQVREGPSSESPE